MTIVEIIFVIVAFFANIIQALTGFAGTVLAMPISITLVGYDVARPILNLVAIFICLVVVIVDYKKINLKRLLTLLIFVGIGFGLGALIQFLNIDSKLLLRTYGTIICFIAIALLLLEVDGRKVPKVVKWIILVIAGIIHFLYTSGGPLVVLFLASTVDDKREFRATLSMMWVVLNTITFITNIVQGAFTPHIWVLSAVVLASAILSMVIGKFILKRIDTKAFMKLTYVLLFISGVFAVI